MEEWHDLDPAKLIALEFEESRAAEELAALGWQTG